MKPVRYVLTAAGSLCLLLTGGCLLALIPERFDSNEHVLGVRYDAQGNVFEHLVKKESYVVQGNMMAEESSSKSHATRAYVERARQSRIRYKSLESIGRDLYGKRWYHEVSRDWHFRPILTTNLWLAVHGPCQLYQSTGITNAWERDIDFTVYAFGPEHTLSEKHLRTFAPRARHGFPELNFDSQNQRLTYNTRHGYETYSLLEGTISPTSAPPLSNSLFPRDFGLADTWQVSHFLGWTNLFVEVEGPIDEYSRSTNTLVFRTYIHVGESFHEQTVITKDFPDKRFLHFDEGDRVVTYRGANDYFVYNVLENSLKKKDDTR